MSDTTVVTLIPVTPPTVDLGPDRDFFFCELGPICIDVELTGERIESVTPSVGQYNAETGQVCFLPETPSPISLVVEVADDCNNIVADTVEITYEFNAPPTVAGPNDTTIVLCRPGEICLPFAVFDPNADSLTNDSQYWYLRRRPGLLYAGGRWCL